MYVIKKVVIKPYSQISLKYIDLFQCFCEEKNIMSEINYSALDEHIQSGKPSPVYMICGEDGYLRRSSLEKLKNAYMPTFMPEMNYSEFDGSKCTINEIANTVEMLPMMTDRRMVVVKDLDAAAIGSEQYKKLEELLGSIEDYDTCVLIFFMMSEKSSSKSGDKQSSLRSLIKKHGTVINCKTPISNEIADIILDYAKSIDTKLSRSDASYMVERCGSDIINLLSEVAKLSSLCAGQITRKAIDENTSQSVDVKAYMLASNVIQGKRREAFTVMNELFDDKTEPVVVLAILSGSFIDLYRVSLAVSQGKRAEDMTSIFGDEYKGKEKKLSFSFRDARRYPTELIKKWCEMLFKADVELKSSPIESRIIMERLLAEMFTAAEVRR